MARRGSILWEAIIGIDPADDAIGIDGLIMHRAETNGEVLRSTSGTLKGTWERLQRAVVYRPLSVFTSADDAMNDPAQRTALVLGATGGIGGETAAALIRHGWRVVAMVRDPDQSEAQSSDSIKEVTWIGGDALNRSDVERAAAATSVIVHAVNPPGYRNWRDLVLPMIDNTIAAAKTNGARVVMPGTIYNYGPDAFPVLREDSPQHPATEKGKIRVELERRLEQASREHASALIVRFGDFFGPSPGNSWFSQGMVTPGKPLKAITYPGEAGIGHAWAYLPDAGETVAQLLEQEHRLDRFARFHFSGHWDADGTRMIAAIREALGRTDIPVRHLPWPLLAVAGLFQQTPRELYKMRYLWGAPVSLDDSRLTAMLGKEPHTPLVEAVKTTLTALDIT